MGVQEARIPASMRKSREYLAIASGATEAGQLGCELFFSVQHSSTEGTDTFISQKDVTVIVQQGTDILKTLYKSSNDHIKVRALVGLCKLGASGGSDASLRPLAEGSTTKLAEACRRFLINPQKDFDLRRWAAEGLSFLTMDAEVKEKLVEDEAALK